MISYDRLRHGVGVMFFLACFFQLKLVTDLNPLMFSLGVIFVYINVVHYALFFTFRERVEQKD